MLTCGGVATACGRRPFPEPVRGRTAWEAGFCPGESLLGDSVGDTAVWGLWLC